MYQPAHLRKVSTCVLIALLILVFPGSASAGNNTWTGVGPASQSINAIVINPTLPGTLYAATEEGVYKSVSGGGTWTPVNTGLPAMAISQLAINPQSPATLYAAAGSQLYKSTNSGSSWNSSGSTPYPIKAIAIAPSTPSTVYMANYDGVYRSTNSGSNWYFAGLYNYNVVELAVDPNSASTLYAGTWGGGVYKSTNSGGNWDSVSEIWYIYSLVIAPTTPVSIYAGTNQGIFRSTDGGDSWDLINPTGTSVYSIAIDPGTPTTLYANIYANRVYQSTNSGTTWHAVGGDELVYKTIQTLAVDSSAPAIVYAGSSTDGIYAFQEINNPVPVLNGLSPETKNVGDATFELSLIGAGFTEGSTALWGNTELATTYASPTLLTATVPGSLLAEPASVDISVFSPAPGGGTSNTISFTIIYGFQVYLPQMVH